MDNDSRDSVQQLCNEAMDEVLELRFQEGKVGPHSAPAAVMEELWEVRGRLDRTEELLLQTYRLKEKYRRQLDAAKAVYQEKWDEESHRIQTSITSRMNDYASSKERSAEINLKLLTYLRHIRVSEDLYAIANETYYYIQTVHKGLENLKRDLDSVIRLFQIESSIGGRK